MAKNKQKKWIRNFTVSFFFPNVSLWRPICRTKLIYPFVFMAWGWATCCFHVKLMAKNHQFLPTGWDNWWNAVRQSGWHTCTTDETRQPWKMRGWKLAAVKSGQSPLKKMKKNKDSTGETRQNRRNPVNAATDRRWHTRERIKYRPSPYRRVAISGHWVQWSS